MAKDKKKIATAIAGITSALRKGYDLLNQEGQLPEVENADLAGIGHHILKALKKELDELSENARFEGMTYEEMLAKKEDEKQAAIAQNLADANEAFRKMTQPEPVEVVDEEEAGGEPGEPGGDESDDEDQDDGLNQYSLEQFLALRGDVESHIKNLEVGTEEFEQATFELKTLNERIQEMQDALKA